MTPTPNHHKNVQIITMTDYNDGKLVSSTKNHKNEN